VVAAFRIDLEAMSGAAQRTFLMAVPRDGFGPVGFEPKSLFMVAVLSSYRILRENVGLEGSAFGVGDAVGCEGKVAVVESVLGRMTSHEWMALAIPTYFRFKL
jgi:hypothetical protein